MGLSFCSFSSSSSGNCYLVRSKTTALLIDAGISGKKVLGGLAETGIPQEMVQGILVTHEHSDHVKSLKVVAKKLSGAMVYANRGTWRQICESVCKEQRQEFITGKMFTVGDIDIKPFHISHDAAEPVGYSFFSEGKQICVVTDTGYITDEIFCEMKQADIIALEANHDENMLKVGRYPWSVKQRILGEKGHLSNVAAGKCLCRIIDECGTKPRKILLAHLSKENNFPEMAYQTIKNVLEESEYYLGRQLQINTMSKDEISMVYEV